MKQHVNGAVNKAGLFTLPLRWVIGWTYLSAFWRRLVFDNKLIPEEAGYIGEKFNHFLPNALGIKPIIEFLVSNPEELQVSMIIFTIVEATDISRKEVHLEKEQNNILIRWSLVVKRLT